MKFSDFPIEIKNKVKERVEEQGNVYTQETETLLNGNISSDQCQGSFDWAKTPEKYDFWNKVLTKEDFNLFFKKYPKDNQYTSNEKPYKESSTYSIDAFQASIDPCDPCNSDYFEIGDEVEVVSVKNFRKHWFNNINLGDRFIIENFGKLYRALEFFNNGSDSAYFNSNKYGVNWTKDMLRIVRKGSQLDNSNNKIHINHGKVQQTSSPVILGFTLNVERGTTLRGETLASSNPKITVGN